MADEPGIFEIMYSCRAMRRLKPDPVPEELLVRLVDAANQAPSGSNRQTARWIIVRDTEIKRELADLNRAAVTSYIATPPDSAPHQDPEKQERMRQTVLWQMEHMHEIPALIVGCQIFQGKPDIAEIARAGGSIWPGIQNLLLAARSLGLGAAPTTLALRDREAAGKVLALPENVHAYCMIPVGYPMGRFGPVTRIPTPEIIHWDRWS